MSWQIQQQKLLKMITLMKISKYHLKSLKEPWTNTFNKTCWIIGKVTLFEIKAIISDRECIFSKNRMEKVILSRLDIGHMFLIQLNLRSSQHVKNYEEENIFWKKLTLTT